MFENGDIYCVHSSHIGASNKRLAPIFMYIENRLEVDSNRFFDVPVLSEYDRNGGAFFGLAFQLNLAVVVLDGVFDDGKSQTSAAGLP